MSVEESGVLGLLHRDVAELKQDVASLFDCLTRYKILRQSQVEACIHRHRFQALLLRCPCSSTETFLDLMMDPGIVHPTLRFAGIPTTGQVAACSQALNHSTSISQKYAVSPTRLYLLGGSTGDGAPLNTALCFDAVRGDWSELPPMPTARDVLAAAACDGRIYAMGGKDSGRASAAMDCYDPEERRWLSCASMSIARGGLGAAADSGRIFAVGGSDGRHALNVVERYDCKTNTWARTLPLSTKRRGVAVTTMAGYIYAIGGTDGREVLSSVESLCTLRGAVEAPSSWTPLTPMLCARRAASAACVKGKIFVVGGAGQMGAQGGCLEVGEFFEPGKSWEPLPPMQVARRGLAAMGVNDVLYVFGGSDAERCTASVEAFDAVLGTWTDQPPMPLPRENFGAAQTQMMEMLGFSVGPATRQRFGLGRLPSSPPSIALDRESPGLLPDPLPDPSSIVSSSHGISRWG